MLALWPLLLLAQPATEELEARLAAAAGVERLALLADLGTAWLEEDPAMSLAFGSEAVALSRELGDRSATVAALRRVGEAHERLGDPENALGFFRQSLALARRIGEKREIPGNLRRIGDIHRREGRLNAAAETLRRGLAAAAEIDAAEEIRDLSYVLAETYAAMGRPQEAYDELRRYDEVRSEIDRLAAAERAAAGPDPSGASRSAVSPAEAAREAELEREIAGLRRELAERRTASDAAAPGLPELAGPALAVGTALLVLLVLALYGRHRLAVRTSRQLAEQGAELERIAEEAAELEASSRRRVAELEAETAEAHKRISEQERYTTLLSHDLKIPLIAIHGYLGLLQQDALAGDVARLRKDAERIQGLVGKMAGLLDRLLELSRIGRELESPQEVPLGELAREAVEMVTSQIADRRVEVAISPDLPAVWGDRPRLLEVLQNLIENAVKFMGPQTEPRVEIGWETRPEPVYYVRDNGIGVDPRHHEKVFRLFERLDQAKEGHGIGLALVERIVEAHGGRVWVESEGAAAGSTFCFTLAAKEGMVESEWETKPGVEVRPGSRHPARA